MAFIEEKIRILCKNLKEQAKQSYGSLERLEYIAADGYKRDNTPPADGWQELTPEKELQGKDAHYWIRAEFTSPAPAENHYLVLEAITGKEGLWDATNPQGLLYLNGEMVQGYDTNHTEAFLETDTHYEMYNYMYMGMQSDPIRLRMRICSIDQRIEKLYYDFLVPFEACLIMNQNTAEYVSMMAVLEQAANLVDMRDIYSDSYFRSLAEAEAFLESELYTKLCKTDGKPVINYIGHTHIDMEWRWTRAQSREKIQRSFATAAALMKKYPEYKFMLSQPGLYRYLKEEAPEKYAELKQLVKEGRWEPEGAMWVEADCNLISGESFVRQILQGKKFFREEFGVDCRVLFLPDVFGYSAAMPQILKKCGIDFFVTSKISWNETNRMPVDEFLWQGIDGTEIFTSFITAQNAARNQDTKTYTTYNGTISSAMHKGAWDRFQQKAYGRRTLVTFGFGDGGGGPTKDMLENFRRLKRGLPGMPAAEMGFIVPYLEQLKREFEENCKKTKRTPKWVGELYMEMHRGTYTSMAKVKRSNRKCELMLQKAEGLSYLNLLFGGRYDADGLYRNWNTILHNQFHDILPGDSIGAVYEYTDADYAQVQAYCENLTKRQLEDIAARVAGKTGVLVYNPLGFDRAGIVTVDGVTAEIAEKIPAFGWRVLNASDIRRSCEGAVTVSGRTISNRYYRMTLDRAGRISSLKDLRADREVFRPGCAGNELQVFEDYPRKYDNFEITDYYKQKCWILDDDAGITPISDGVRAGLRIERQYMHSLIVQNVWLYADSPRIDFDTVIDWHEHHQIMKAAFPVDVNASSATYEIQFGHVSRPTHENTSWDQAKFEVYGHKWVDIAENGYGVSLLNDCKYGYSAEGSTLKLTILKCGTDPNPDADQGQHILTYSLLPHEGDFREAGIIREAYCLNQSLEAVSMPGAEGGSSSDQALPAEFSLASCSKENVVLETVKKAEADEGMILRAYEAFNRRTKAVITVAEGFSRAYLCDLMENVLEELPFDGKRVSVQFTGFEIITLKFVR